MQHFGELTDKFMLTASTHALNVPGHRGKSQLREIRHSGEILHSRLGGHSAWWQHNIGQSLAAE